jgi:hypothetical protein
LSNLIEQRFKSYPEEVSDLAFQMKTLLYEVAETEGIKHIEESFKWGEPSFKAPDGSPIRMDWKEKTPEYFKTLYFTSA